MTLWWIGNIILLVVVAPVVVYLLRGVLNDPRLAGLTPRVVTGAGTGTYAVDLAGGVIKQRPRAFGVAEPALLQALHGPADLLHRLLSRVEPMEERGRSRDIASFGGTDPEPTSE